VTHDELLAKMAEPAHNLNANDARNIYLLALRAVVELHQPRIIKGSDWQREVCRGCDIHTYEGFCPTIQAIEKELE
jgi:hypothetical protein